MKHVTTRRTYLEMSVPSPRAVERPDGEIVCKRLEKPSVELYRELYARVGRQFHWVDRLIMPPEELEHILHDERVEIYLLKVDGETAGYSELDRRARGEIELAYFGLFADFIGRGLGRFFLDWAITRAWSYEPDRVWVHTCDLDHPAALPNYLKAGFVVYKEEMVRQAVLDE